MLFLALFLALGIVGTAVGEAGRWFLDGFERVGEILVATADGKGVEVRAEAGYAVAGLYVKSSRRVDGLAVLVLEPALPAGLDDFEITQVSRGRRVSRRTSSPG